MELNCPKCSKKISEFKKYIFHIEFFHKISNSFSCPVQGCSRIYHTSHSLKYHLRTQHTLDAQEPNSEFPLINLEFCDTNADKANMTPGVHVDNSKEIQQKISGTFLEDFKNLLNNTVQHLIAKLYNILNLNRDTIQNIIVSLDLFLTQTVDTILQSLGDKSESRSNELLQVLSMLSLFMNAFKKFDTEYKRHKLFTKSNFFIEPAQIEVGVSQEVSKRNGIVEMVLKNRTICSMPWQNNLKTFLELPNVLKTITDNQSLLLQDSGDGNSNILRNVVNGSVWRNKLVTVAETLLPLIIYFDDFETGNPLGSHAGIHKIGVIYISIATLPPDMSSRLENIFVALIFNSNDREEFGNKAIFSKFIYDLNFLFENGLQVCIENNYEIVKFQVIVFSGDNLGIHSVFGLSGSFSAQNYCRFCTIPKNECINLCEERQSSLRKETDYNNHLEAQFGLKEKCIWHDLHDFHIYKNLTCDVMHDLCEGVYRYSMAFIIEKLIIDQYFSLETLNSRIKYFTYQSFEKNVPAEITRNHLINGCIIVSASEMLCLVRNFVYMVGDLIPVNNLIWENYLQLREITDILMAQVVSQDMLAYLRTLIEEHHSSYLTLYGKTLKPKYHFLTHYCTIIEKIGPPVLISAFKFEAKHRHLKKVAQSISSRKNLPYSLAVRCQYQHLYRVLSQTGLEDRVKYGKTEAYDLNIIPEYLKNYKCYCYTWYEINGVKYSSQDSLVYKYENDNPLFYKIDKVIIPQLPSSNVYFFCRVLKTLGYCSHLQSFKVENTTCFAFIEKSDCFSSTPLMIHEVSGMGNFISL